MTTLDGLARALDAEDMVICDETDPISLAAVTGGETGEWREGGASTSGGARGFCRGPLRVSGRLLMSPGSSATGEMSDAYSFVVGLLGDHPSRDRRARRRPRRARSGGDVRTLPDLDLQRLRWQRAG
nr:hypothetical protein [Actinoplanes siamensis]